MKEVWTYQYGDNTIEVRNNRATELYVNGELQDQKKGIYFSTTLKGKLGNGEVIEASLGGFFKVECTVLVGDKVLYPVSVKNVKSTG